MCHTEKLSFFGDLLSPSGYAKAVDGLCYRPATEKRRIAVVPDIYGLTDFYQGYASYLAGFGATTFLVNPWSGLGDLPEMTREAAFERRHKLKDRAFADQLEAFLVEEKIDAVVGFCIGGNFVLYLASHGYQGDLVAIYPLPWGMDNQDKIPPAYNYMPSLEKDVTIIMGEADQLAGPDNIKTIQTICAGNPALKLHSYSGSNHGFFNDISGSDEALAANARDGIAKVNQVLFGE